MLDGVTRSGRRERLRAVMVEASLDLLVLAHPANVDYAAGYRSVAAEIIPETPIAVLLGPDELVVVAPAADAAVLEEAGISRFVPYGRFYFESQGSHPALEASDRYPSFLDALAAAVEGFDGRRVGVDGRVDGVMRTVIGRHGASVADASDLVYRARAVKLPGEVEALRRAAGLACAGIDAALAQAGPGVTERELATVVAATMAAGGAHPRFVVVGFGERSAFGDARPTDRPWRAGELARFDVGCQVEGYWSDVGRTAVLGEPDPRQLERYAAILAGEDAEIAAVTPGIRADEVFALAVESVEAHGLRPYRRHHCGHTIGLEVYERPVVAPGWGTLLDVGMVLCLETPYYELGWGGMMVEDTVVVGERGAEVLTGSSRELRVVAA